MNRDDLLDRLVAEYADLRAGDRAPPRAEFAAEHPEVRTELDRLLAIMEAADGDGDGAPIPASPAEGERLGDFVLVRERGRGGMGVVYEARQIGVDRTVALKVLRSHLTLDARQVDRFRREARAAGRLHHPSVVTLHTVGEDRGHHFIAMDLVEGPSLAEVIVALAREKAPVDAAAVARVSGRADVARCASSSEALVRLLLPALEGVQAAHDAGLVHRDLKPSNILLDRAGLARVADFGLARAETDAWVTATGEPVGTPHYMSPEQARAARTGVDARTDVYSLGVTLYEMLTLRVPFRGDSVVEVLGRILRESPPAPRSLCPSIPRDLEAVVLKAMSREPEKRYGSPRALAEDLRAVLEERSTVARVPGLLERVGRMFDGRTQYRSVRSFRGLPLVHISFAMDPETGRPATARGWLAIGGRAVGGIAIGGVALGVISFGGLSLGLLSFGGLAIGGLALGGGAIGAVALGGGALGIIAVGGGAFGWMTAGGEGHGTYILDQMRRDPEAVAFFHRWMPALMRVMGL
jgi:serine/threonine protein kinase